jgi:hypothetical protein
MVKKYTSRLLGISRGGAVAVATLLAVLGLLFSVGTANATNGGDPQSGCAASMSRQSSVAVLDHGSQVGTAYLRYSGTCGTQWVTVVYNVGYSGQPSVWMQNQNGTNLYAVYSDNTESYTYQLSGMAYQVGCGGVQMYHNGVYLEWVYIGCF